MGGKHRLLPFLLALALAGVLLLLVSYRFTLALGFLGTVPLGLGLMWLVRRRARGKDIAPVSEEQEAAQARVSAWLVLVVASLLALLAVVLMLRPGDEAALVPTLRFLLWLFLLFLVSLTALAWSLLFRRGRTGFPRWSVGLGAVLAGGLLGGGLLLLSISVFNRSENASLGPGPGVGDPQVSRQVIVRPGAGAFQVACHVHVKVSGSEPARVVETCEAKPLGGYDLLDIVPEPQEGFSQATVEQAEPLVLLQEGRTFRGMRFQVVRAFQPRMESLGLLRARFELPLPETSLRVESVDGKEPEGTAQKLPTSDFTEAETRLEVELPRNSLLDVYPKPDELRHLPDRDVLVAELEGFEEAMDIYWLKTGRFGPVRRVLSEASEYEAVLHGLVWLLGPVLGIVIAAYQKQLADRVLGLFRRDRERNPKPPIGFRMDRDAESR